MSGGGGFYKFRCKYFLSHECPNWVYLNGSACAECAVSKRTNTLMEVEVVLSDNDEPYWAVMYRVDQQPQTQVPTTTSALPGAPTTTTSF
ncbi:hypothetical protein GGS24DRAFT_451151 [Hypoxylon argillaceum]|nr:hypothetical protein GGS24DRAFT_451151 [Hypoxylon argillaceum]